MIVITWYIVPGKNNLNVSIETHSSSVNLKGVQPNPSDAWGLPSRTSAWYPQSKSTSAMLCLQETLSVFSVQSPYPSIQIPADHSPQGCSRSLYGPKKYALSVSMSPIFSSLAHLKSMGHIHGNQHYDFCQIKSITFVHSFVHHKLNTIGLKIWAPGWGKPSQFPKGTPA